MVRLLSFFAWLLIVFSLFSCEIDKPDAPKYPIAKKGDTVSRTLIVYAMAENSLSNYVFSDIDEIFAAATEIPDNCRLFTFVDNSDVNNSPYICQFYNNNGVSAKDTVFVFEEDFCSSESSALNDVLEMILTDYPTETLDIVMWSHGNGWLRHNPQKVPFRSIGVDNGKNSYSNSAVDVIEIEELATVLESLPVRVNRLMFDACFMQSVEVAYALRNSVDWIIASPAEIPGDGAPYDKIVPLFFSQTVSVGEIIDAYKEDYDASDTGVILSAVKCDELEYLAEATYTYVKKYFDKDAAVNVDNLFSYLNSGYYSSSVSYPAFYDMNAVMKKSLGTLEYIEWKKALYAAVQYLNYSDSWYTAVLGRYIAVDSDVCSGISMYIPQVESYRDVFNADFATTEWYSAAGWNETGW